MTSSSLIARLCPAGLRGSLERLQLEYVDIVFANRMDANSPMEGEANLITVTFIPILSLTCVPP